jgi:hypothetical protein
MTILFVVRPHRLAKLQLPRRLNRLRPTKQLFKPFLDDLVKKWAFHLSIKMYGKPTPTEHLFTRQVRPAPADLKSLVRSLATTAKVVMSGSE